MCTAPLQYIPKIQLTQTTIDCLTKSKTKNARDNKTIISNYILVVTQLATVWLMNHLLKYYKGTVHQKGW